MYNVDLYGVVYMQLSMENVRMRRISVVCFALAMAFNANVCMADNGKQVAPLHEIAGDAVKPLPVVTYGRKLVADMRNYTRLVIDGHADGSAKQSVLTDVKDIRSTLDDAGALSADTLIRTIKAFDGKVENMKPVWSSVADLMIEITRLYKVDVLHQIARD